MSEDHQEEWGPWIEHDLGGCPVEDGAIVEAEIIRPSYGRYASVFCLGIEYSREDWDFCDRDCAILLRVSGQRVGILRYRIRKPRGLQILETLLNDLPEPVRREPERVGA